MKHLFLFTIIILFTYQTQAQKIRFSDPTNTWKVSALHERNPGHIKYKVFSGCGYGDSVITNGHLYRKLSGYIGYSVWIREDTLKGVIYCKFSLTDTTEFVYFDYNIQVGDTFKCPIETSYYSTGTQKILITEVDSLIINNTFHKKFKGHYLIGTYFEFIEGVGETRALPQYILAAVPWYAGRGTDHNVHVYCFLNKGQVPNLDSGRLLYNCTNPYLAVKQIIYPSNIKLYPQPAHSYFTIELPAKINNGTLDIYNNIGQSVYQKIITNQNTLKATNLNLPTGVYYYTVQGYSKQNQYRGKLLIE